MKIFGFETYIYPDYPILNLIKYNRRDMIAWSQDYDIILKDHFNP